MQAASAPGKVLRGLWAPDSQTHRAACACIPLRGSSEPWTVAWDSPAAEEVGQIRVDSGPISADLEAPVVGRAQRVVSELLGAGFAFYSSAVATIFLLCAQPHAGHGSGSLTFTPYPVETDLAGVRPWESPGPLVSVCLPEVLREFRAQLWFHRARVWILALGRLYCYGQASRKD